MTRPSLEAFADELLKMAADEAPPSSGQKYLRALKHVGVGLLGLGTGHVLGQGAGHLIGKATGGRPVPGADAARWVFPTAAAASGLAYSLWQQEQKDKVQRALQGSRE